MNWTEEVVVELLRLNEEGLSGSMMAAQLGATKNAVIGKLHRLGVQMKNATVPAEQKKIQGRGRPDLFKDKSINAVPIFSTPTIEMLNVPFTDLAPHHCRFICAEPDGYDTVYCGTPRQSGSSYCPGHHLLVWRKPPPKTGRPFVLRDLRREHALQEQDGLHSNVHPTRGEEALATAQEAVEGAGPEIAQSSNVA